MRAAVYGGPERIEVKEVPTPAPGQDEVLLKVEACAICGTDVRIYWHGQKNVQPGAITGHEIAGTVAEIGEGVQGYEVGQPAVLVTPVGCGRCKFCRAGIHNLCLDFRAIGYDFPGGFAEYVLLNAEAVRQGNIIPMSPDVPFDEASLVEPLSCCVNGQEYLDIGIGDRVAVFGAGPIGSMHVELAASKGATQVILIEPDPARMAMAKERVSADRYVLASEEDPVQAVLDATDGEGVDVAISACSAHQAQVQAMQVAAKRARVSFFAGLPKDKPTITFDSNALHYREIAVYGAFASHATQYVQALALIAGRKVDGRKFMTRTLSLEQIPQAIREYKQGKDLKMVVRPWT